MKKTFVALTGLLMMFGFTGLVSAAVNPVTPSTNDINRTNEWAHVNQLSMDIGTTDLEFVSTRSFYSCFEYRTDGDTSQMVDPTNPNGDITDGLYPYFCENNSSSTHTFNANEYVEVRMVFGAEGDERFDWTRFDVMTPPPTKAETLMDSGVQGKGLENALGLQKPFNSKSNAAENVGKEE
jgi:hypothetical protein